MTKDEIIEMAKEAHRKLVTEVYVGHIGQLDPWTIELLKIFAKLVAAKERQALAQPEQEPVAWGVDWGKAGDIPCVSIIKRLPDGGIQVIAVEYAPYSYTTPPQRTWQGLTDEEIDYIYTGVRGVHHEIDLYVFARAIEAKLKEKNT